MEEKEPGQAAATRAGRDILEKLDSVVALRVDLSVGACLYFEARKSFPWLARKNGKNKQHLELLGLASSRTN